MHIYMYLQVCIYTSTLEAMVIRKEDIMQCTSKYLIALQYIHLHTRIWHIFLYMYYVVYMYVVLVAMAAMSTPCA